MPRVSRPSPRGPRVAKPTRADSPRKASSQIEAKPDATLASSASTYLEVSKKPLQVLIFLLPMLVLYELGTILFLREQGVVEVVRARLMLTQFLDVFGAIGFHLPPVLLCVVLLAWHAVSKDKTVFRGHVVAGMGFESLAWAMFLVVIGAIIGGGVAFAQAGPIGTDPPPPQALPLMARLTLSIGAGLYEELVFRWILIALVHFVAVDLMRAKEHWGYAAAIALSAISFAFYHNLAGPAGIDGRLLLIYLLGGAYFAVLFVVRGFGIAVATHVLYDVIALTILA
jgi:hypothetical protein